MRTYKILMIDYFLDVDKRLFVNSEHIPISWFGFLELVNIEETQLSVFDFIVNGANIMKSKKYDGLLLPVYCGGVQSDLSHWGHPNRPTDYGIPFAYQVLSVANESELEMPPTLVWSCSNDTLFKESQRLIKKEGIKGVEFILNDDRNVKMIVNRWLTNSVMKH